MDTNLYSWWLKQTRAREANSLFSSIQKVAIQSMAKLGKMRDMRFGEENPYFRHKKQIGVVVVPQELSKLLKVVPDSDIWFLGDIGSGQTNRDWAYEIWVYGDIGIDASLYIYYAVNSGVVALDFKGARVGAFCRVPSGFSLDDLVRMLGSDGTELEEFVLKYGKLNKAQVELIEKYGL